MKYIVALKSESSRKLWVGHPIFHQPYNTSHEDLATRFKTREQAEQAGILSQLQFEVVELPQE